MDFLSCNSSACLQVIGCSDLTLQIAAYCSGISSSLCLSRAKNSADDQHNVGRVDLVHFQILATRVKVAVYDFAIIICLNFQQVFSVTLLD